MRAFPFMSANRTNGEIHKGAAQSELYAVDGPRSSLNPSALRLMCKLMEAKWQLATPNHRQREILKLARGRLSTLIKAIKR